MIDLLAGVDVLLAGVSILLPGVDVLLYGVMVLFPGGNILFSFPPHLHMDPGGVLVWRSSRPRRNAPRFFTQG